MKGKLRRLMIATGVLLGAMASPLATVSAQTNSAPGTTVTTSQLNSQEATLVEVFDLMQKEHVDPVDSQKLLDAAINGMIQASGDPFTDYFTAEEYQAFVHQINLQYSGIGVSIKTMESGGIEIAAVMPGEPAAIAGLQTGDVIVSINGQTVTKMTDQAVSNLILGQAGTKVTMMISRNGKLVQPPYVITRAQIQLHSVFSQMTKDGLGYISIYDFADHTAAEFSQALTDLTAQGAKGIIIDLRGNPGGLIDQALQIASDFLHSGEILSVRDAQGNTQQYDATSNGSDLPITFLVNKGSASAAEALAGSLQALHRATVIGTETFGKGTMQVPITLPDGSVLKLTVAKYYFVNGSNPNGIGLTPDISITYPSLQYNEAVQVLVPIRKETIHYTIGQSGVVLNGVVLDAPSAIKREGVIYLPLRFTAEAFGTPIGWDPSGRIISTIVNNKLLEYAMDAKQVTFGGKLAKLHHPLDFMDGRAYVSLEDLSAFFGMESDVSGTSVTVHPS